MPFNSAPFLFAFLPLVVFGAVLLGRRGRFHLQAWLLLCSLFFYGWQSPSFLPLFAGIAAFNYAAGSMLLRSPSRKILAFSVAANILLLGVFKYAGFLAESVNDLFAAGLKVPDIQAPPGISFTTFVMIAFLADCHHRKTAARINPASFSLFAAFFPQILSGPIVRHAEMAPQYERIASPRAEAVAAGLSLFALGLFKKVFIADVLAPYADTLFGQAALRPLSAPEAWVAMLAYTFQIYFDFSGYSDMALGAAKMAGVRLPLNFFSPYKAASIIDFWRRWHMTLSRFLRDYLYITLGGSKKGTPRKLLNLMLTMLLGGLWHGPAWTFVLWGGLHGLFLVVNHLWRSAAAAPRLPAFLTRLMTFLGVAFAWIFFRSQDETTAFSIAAALVPRLEQGPFAAFFSDASPLRESFSAQQANMAVPLIALCAALCWFFPNSAEIMRKGRAFLLPEKLRLAGCWPIWSPAAKCGIITGIILGLCFLKVLYEPSSVFLYFRF